MASAKRSPRGDGGRIPSSLRANGFSIPMRQAAKLRHRLVEIVGAPSRREAW